MHEYLTNNETIKEIPFLSRLNIFQISETYIGQQIYVKI